jgi:hypothetical protein
MSNEINSYNKLNSNLNVTENLVGIKKQNNPIKECKNVFDGSLLKDSSPEKIILTDKEININNTVVSKLSLLYNNLNAIYDVLKDKDFQLLKKDLINDYSVHIIKNNRDIDAFHEQVTKKINAINNNLKDNVMLLVSNIFQNSIGDESNTLNNSSPISLGQALAAIFRILYQIQVSNSKMDSDILNVQIKYFRDFIETLSSILVKYEDVEKQQNRAAIINLSGAITGLATTVGGFSASLAGISLYRNSHINKLTNDANKLKFNMEEFFNNKDANNILSVEDHDYLGRSLLDSNFLGNMGELEQQKASLSNPVNNQNQQNVVNNQIQQNVVNNQIQQENVENNQNQQNVVNNQIQQENVENNQIQQNVVNNQNQQNAENNQNQQNVEQINRDIECLRQKLVDKTALDEKYQKLGLFKDKLLEKKEDNYVNEKLHEFENKGILEDILKSVDKITPKYIKELLAKDPKALSTDQKFDLYSIAKLKEFYEHNDVKSGIFSERFKQIIEFYKSKQEMNSRFGDTVQATSRFMTSSMEASANQITALANKEQSQAGLDDSKAVQALRLYTSYTDNRKKSYDNVVDQILQLIFKFSEEIGALAH